MKLWTEFYDTLLPDVPGCNPAMANIALRHAAREFCERTKAWDEWRGPQLTVATSIQYDFDIATTEEVVKLLGATLAGCDLKVLSVNDLPNNWQTYTGCTSGILTQDRRTFYVIPQREAGIEIRTRVALKPSNKGTGVSDELFAHYLEDICVGARARLHTSIKKPYTDKTTAAECRADFDQRMAKVARAVEKSFSRVPRRVIPNFF